MVAASQRALRVSAFMVAIVAVPAAWADVHASLTVGPLQAQLTDLAPDDGQASAWHFANATSGASTTLNLTPSTMVADGWWVPVSQSQSLAGVSGQAAVAADGISVSGTVGSAGNAFGIGASTQAGLLLGDPGQGLYLSPHSELTLSVSFDMSVAVDAMGCARGCESTIANLDFGTDGSTFEAVSLDSSTATSLTASKQGTLSFTLRNDSDQWTDRFFFVQAVVEGAHELPAAPVPEPATGAMLGLGLGLCALAARRRRR